jgi:seryl-tRNA synthetase
MTESNYNDLAGLPGYRWFENGQSALSGDLLKLYHELDRRFLRWAAAWSASEYAFPPFIAAAELQKAGYLGSFPHLATFPMTLEPEEKNLQAFSSGDPVNARGEIQWSAPSPIRDVLTPAACYHFYTLFQNRSFDRAVYVTTRAACFRREMQYRPLQRQWSFAMREVVCLGTADEVKEFLESWQRTLDRFFRAVRLPVRWQDATDPFFNPARNSKYLSQKLEPVKTEMVFNESLAIGSMNFHRNFFGEAFQIERDGKEIFSGCVAFGLERWIFAFLSQFGWKAADWPVVN